ncbi:MAG: RNA polymerase sigma-70 factor [Muribaculaceae bacterium]
MQNFEDFYINWYSRAKRFAYEYVLNEVEAEDIVQDIFVKLYEHREVLDAFGNPTAYLLTSVKNRCLDYLRRKVEEQGRMCSIDDERFLELRISLASLASFDADFPDEASIEERLQRALDALPERAREVFVMSKIRGIRQQQIAEMLGISINTVESQMAIAYAKLRSSLRDCLPLLMFLCAMR